MNKVWQSLDLLDKWIERDIWVTANREGNIPISQAEIPPEGRLAHLKRYWFIKVFRMVSQNGDQEYSATDDLQMDEAAREELESEGWEIKQCCAIQWAQVRKAAAHRNQFLYGLRAFLALEMQKL